MGHWVTGLTLCSLFFPPLLAWLPIPLPSFPLRLAPPIPPAAGPLLLPRPLVFRFSADGRPLLEGGGAGAAGSLLLAPLAGWPGAGLRLLGAPSPPEEQLLPVRLSPVGAYSPPTRGALPCLASPELALLLSPLFPRSSTFPAAAPPPRQVPAPPLPPQPRPPKAPRWTRSPSPPPRLRKTDPGKPRGPRLRRAAPPALRPLPLSPGPVFAFFLGLPSLVPPFSFGRLQASSSVLGNLAPFLVLERGSCCLSCSVARSPLPPDPPGHNGHGFTQPPCQA